MNEQKYPLLEKLHVLRTATLAAIRDQAFEALPLLHMGYSDGVVSGCEVIAGRGSLEVQPGLVNHEEYMYFLREPMRIPYQPTEEYAVLKLKFAMVEERENFRRRQITLMLTPDLNIGGDEIELCRFKLKAGAVLRNKYVDYWDRSTEFDTINNIMTPCSSPGHSTLLPEIVMSFAREVRSYKLNSLDETFCLAALSGRPLSYEQILFYISRRLQIPPENGSNMYLYKKLGQILQEIKGGGRTEIQQTRRNKREILVD